MAWGRMLLIRVSAQEAQAEYGIAVIEDLKPNHYDAIILAVGHNEFLELGVDGIRKLGRGETVLFDIKSLLPKDASDQRL